MDAVMLFLAHLVIAAAIHSGLSNIASAIRVLRYGAHEVRVNGFVTVKKENDGTPA